MDSINAKHLREFLLLSSVGSISAAARALYISPQGLSKTIKKMETDLGVKLFRRTQQGMVLTPEGEALQARAATIIDEIESIHSAALRQQGDSTHFPERNLHLEMTFGSIDFFTLEQIDDFEAAHQNTQIHVNEGTDQEIQTHLLEGKADVGLCIGPIDNTRFNGTYLHSRRHCLVINRSNPLSRRTSLSYRDLKDEKLIFESKEFSAYNNNMNRCLKAGFEPHVVFCAANLHYAHKLSSDNKGIAISVEDVAREHHYENTVIVPFSDEDCLMDVYMLTSKATPPKPDVVALTEYIKQWASEFNRMQQE